MPWGRNGGGDKNELATSEATSVEELFPMMLVRMQDCLRMTSVEPYEQLNANSALHSYAPGKIVGFISHQWLDRHHPDPDFRQFAVFQQAILNIASGAIFVELDYTMQLSGFSMKFSKKDRTQLPSAYIWYDYFSVPQAPESGDELILAIKSIPAYVERSNFFLILVPSLTTASGTPSDYQSWQSRGWCRLEQISRVLVHDGVAPMIVIASPRQVFLVAPYDWMHAYPGEGEFTELSDRESVMHSMQCLIDAKIEKFGWAVDPTGKSTFLTRWFMAMRSRFLSLSAAERAGEHLHSVEHFLRKYHFDRATDIPAPYRVGPLYFALLEGDLETAAALVMCGASVNQSVAKGMTELGLLVCNILTSVMFFAQSIPEAKFLIDRGADLNARAPLSGLMPLNVIKNPQLLQWIWNHEKFQQGSLHENILMGLTPLHFAAMAGDREVARLLLDFDADPMRTDIWGLTALHHITNAADAELARVFLAQCPELVRQPIRRPNRFATLVGRSCAMAVWLNPKRGIVMRMVANIEGATLLHLCCIIGTARVAHICLEVAQHHGWLTEVLAIKNRNGFSALDLALREGHTDIADSLSRAEAPAWQPARQPHHVVPCADEAGTWKVSRL